MKVRKAVVVAAGMGTRMLPASKVIPKEILPVVDTPAIQMIVEEAIASGIEEIIIVITPGRTLVLDHFKPAEDLERYLESTGKHDLLRMLRKTNDPTKLTAAHQAQPLGLGHAVLQAHEAVGNEPFAVFLADDIIDSAKPCLRQLLDVAERQDAPVVALLKVPHSEVSKYGIVEAKPAGDRLYELTGMVEKPSPEKAPSDFAIIGRYVLTPDIFDLIREGKAGAGGEIQLTDSLRLLLRSRPIYAFKFEGKRYDAGDKLGFLKATVEFALQRHDLGGPFRQYLKGLSL